MAFKKTGLWLAGVAAGAFLLSVTPSLAGTNVLFILDSSGSMWEKVDGVPKVTTAKRVLDETLAKLSADTQIGLMTYGHRHSNDCSDIQVLDPIGAEQAAAIAKKVNALSPKGETPIAGALQQSADAFKAVPGERNIIILITDGAESCKGDPCAAARALAAANLDLQINVVGFKLQKKERDAVECIAREGRGTYYDASNIKALTTAMAALAAQVAAPPPPPPEPSLIGIADGGQVIAAPDEGWGKIVTGTDTDAMEFGCTAMPIDVIFAFKDERPATFSKFEILIPETGKFVKDFELLAADNSPGGDYRSLGKFTTANMKMLKSPYQPFAFPETTARYLKFRILSAYPSDCTQLATQIRLIGKLTDTGQPAAQAALDPSAVNLLAPAQGGQVIAAPDDGWAKIITGTDKDAADFGCNSMPLETIFAFKDEQPATFSRFEMLIPYTGKFVKDFELLAADAPGGDYRSLGKFTTANIRMVRDPYQAFTFPEATAKYLKLRVLSAWPSDCSQLATQIRLMGKLAPAATTSAPQPAASPGEVNLLSAAQGGQLLGAPDPSWQSAVSGNDKDVAGFGCTSLPLEAVFAFKGGQAATFSRFEILIPYTGKFVKDFELLAADDSATGTYRSLGKFTTQNLLLAKTPYQSFAFPETTAKFLKLRILSAWPSDCTQSLTQIRLMGKPPT